MRPTVSDRHGRFACRVTGLCGSRSRSVGLSLGGPVSAFRGSKARPTQRVLIATERMPTDRSSTAWPNGYRPPVTVRSRCGLDLLRVCSLCQLSNRRSVPLPPPSDRGQRAEMKPVQSDRFGRFTSRVEGFRGWRALSAGLTRGGQPLRWRLSGDTDAMWLDRCGEDADRPVFHTLTERLPSANVLEGPVDSFSKRGIQ